MNLSQTPYDDVFRTLLNDCSSLILPMINEIFQETYTGTEEIIFSPNEHFQNQQDGGVEHIAEKYEHVKEGVKEVMGGRILEYEAKTILNRGIAQGMERGIEQGVEQGKMELVDVMLRKGKSYEEISELTDIPIEKLKQGVEAIGGESH